MFEITTKRIFLGYPFAIPEIRVAVNAACRGFAQVVSADDRLRGKHLLEKVDEKIQEADLSLFDITQHNPNVAAEFGLAYARGVKWALLYSTDKRFKIRTVNRSRVFSDLQGMDSVPYADYSVLKRELRRLLPEFLDAPHRRPRLSSAASHDSAIRPRLDAKVQPIYSASVGALGSPSKIVKLGEDKLGITLSNDGNGAANAVSMRLTGFTFVDEILAVTRSTAVTRRWPLEDQPAYLEAPSEPIITVRYSDDNGDVYEQSGPLKAVRSGSHFYYQGSGLGPPRALPE